MIAALALAGGAALLMGFAIQRGGTCLVAATAELLLHRRATRLLAIGEAGLWAAAALALARAAGMLATAPADHAVGRWTIAGGLLFGAGAWLNRACALGTVARLGSGELSFAAMPLGFLVGRWLGAPLRPEADAAGARSLLLAHLAIASPILAAFVLWRTAGLVRAGARGRLAAHAWSPRNATGVIGLAFAALLLTVGPWSYTEALGDVAGGMSRQASLRLALFVLLLAGALLGGWTAGRLALARISAAQLGRSFVGGVLMALGSLLLPGGNDALTLTAIPLLQLYGWVGGAAIMAALVPLRLGGLKLGSL